jgi:hypothetical protein
MEVEKGSKVFCAFGRCQCSGLIRNFDFCSVVFLAELVFDRAYKKLGFAWVVLDTPAFLRLILE